MKKKIIIFILISNFYAKFLDAAAPGSAAAVAAESVIDKDRELIDAVVEQKTETVKMLLDKRIQLGINVYALDQFQYSGFLWAAFNDNDDLEILELFVAIPDFDVDRAGGNNTTALMVAARAGNINGVRFLLQNRADRSLQNDKEETALDLAANEQIKQLLSQPIRSSGRLTKRATN